MDALVPLVFLVPLASALLTLTASQGLHRDSARISIVGAVATFLCASGLLGLALAGHTAERNPVRHHLGRSAVRSA